MSKLNSILFKYSEFFSLSFLMYFSIGLSKIFTLFYFGLLIVLGILKSSLFIESDEYNDTTIASISVFLTELAPILLSYTQVLDAGSVIVLVFGTILIILSVKLGVLINADAAIVISTIAAIILYVFRGIDGAALLFVVMLVILNKYVLHTKLALPFFAASIVIPCIILGVNHEYGTMMILLLSISVYVAFFGNKGMRISLLAFIAILFTVWLVIYSNDELYYDILSLSNNDDFKRDIPRIFLRTDEGGQLDLLRHIVFYRNPINYFFTFTGPGYYTEIVQYENDYFTSSADYMFSVFTFFASPYSFIVVLTTLYFMIESIRRNLDKAQVIVPIFCLMRCIVHVFGNISLIPFTGVPFLFLSHGHTCALVSAIMIALQTILEQNSRIDE